MTILGLDVSHYQGTPNFAQVKASGRDFVVLKVTEGSTYLDPAFAANRKAAHAAGLIVGLYHFARAGDVMKEAGDFYNTILPIQPGEFLVLDWEVQAADPVGWSRVWLDTVHNATSVRPLIYMNQSAVNGHNWSPISGTYGLWLARYDNAPTVFNSVPFWGQPAMKQYSDAGTVPGVAGSCDVDSFNGSASQLLAYGYQGADVPLTPADIAAIWNYALDQKEGYGPAQAQDWLRDARIDAAQLSRTDPGSFNGDVRGDLAIKAGQLQQIIDALGNVSTPQIDEAKLAAALLADPKSVDALGAAIAAHLQLAPKADAPTPPSA